MISMERHYRRWLEATRDCDELQVELKAIENDSAAIEDRFYRDLEFGTGGLRGILGAGTNRMNIFTVAKATQGYANYLKETADKPSVAIAYDSRLMSPEFSKEAALCLAANGIKAYVGTANQNTQMLDLLKKGRLIKP